MGASEGGEGDDGNPGVQVGSVALQNGAVPAPRGAVEAVFWRKPLLPLLVRSRDGSSVHDKARHLAERNAPCTPCKDAAVSGSIYSPLF